MTNYFLGLVTLPLVFCLMILLDDFVGRFSKKKKYIDLSFLPRLDKKQAEILTRILDRYDDPKYIYHHMENHTALILQNYFGITYEQAQFLLNNIRITKKENYEEKQKDTSAMDT